MSWSLALLLGACVGIGLTVLGFWLWMVHTFPRF